MMLTARSRLTADGDIAVGAETDMVMEACEEALMRSNRGDTTANADSSRETNADAAKAGLSRIHVALQRVLQNAWLSS